MVELADAYIQLYKLGNKNFILHPEHKVLEDMVVKFSTDLKGYVAFVAKIRDTCTKEQYKEMQIVYRRVNSRYTQIQRRKRLAQAIKIIESHIGVQFTFGQNNAVEAWLENYWSKERLAALDDSRRVMSKNRLTSDERTEICDDFWEAVDEGLKLNVSPIPPEIVYTKLKSLDEYEGSINE